MDFTFLNFFTRTTTIPPIDPWAASNTMLYYYGGTLLFAALHKVSSMPTQYGYWFSVALVQTSLFAVATGILLLFQVTKRWAIIGGMLLILCGNIDTFYLMLTKPHVRGFDLFWATSRVLHSPGINEYPLWSFLFADLHAHYIALPLTLLVLGITIFLFSNECICRFKTTILLSLCWAILAFINSWDFLTYGLVVGLFFLLKIITEASTSRFKSALYWSMFGLLALICAGLFSLPFHLTVSGESNVGWGYVNKDEFNKFSEIFRIHGHWILIILSSILLIVHSIRRLEIIYAAAFGSIPLLLGVYHVYRVREGMQPDYLISAILSNADGIPWYILSFASALCICGAFSLRSCFPFGAMCISLGLLYSISELYYLMDRMNTTFKLYNAIWCIGAVTALSKLHYFFSVPKVIYIQDDKSENNTDTNENFELFNEAPIRTITLSLAQLLMRRFINYVSLVPLVVACFAGAYCIWVMSTFVRVHGPRPTLNGQAYLEKFNPVEKAAIDWINNNIRGTPVLLEAYGPSYQEYTRFSMHTGLPVVLGWDHHVSQRGTNYSEVQERKKDVRTIYTSQDLRQIQILLNKYNVDLIVVGRQERAAYPDGNFSKFANHPGLFPLLFSYSNGVEEVKIYTTSYSELRRYF